MALIVTSVTIIPQGQTCSDGGELSITMTGGVVSTVMTDAAALLSASKSAAVECMACCVNHRKQQVYWPSKPTIQRVHEV